MRTVVKALGRVGRAACPILLVLAVAWLSRYLYAGGFGLYEDDLTIIPQTAEMAGSEVAAHIGNYIVRLYGHGRPFSDSLIYICSWLGWRLGGLGWMYTFGFAFVAVNCILVYTLGWRVSGPLVALLAGLASAVFPADTTQAYLTHSLGLHPSLGLALLAIHAYLSRKDWVTYVLAIAVLFTYETPFGLIAVAPLLLPGPWDRTRLQRLLLHGLVLGVILGAVLAVRVAISDDRVGGLGVAGIFLLPVTHMVQGPLVSMGTFAYRPIQAAQLNTPTGWAIAALAFVAVLGCLRTCSSRWIGLTVDDLRSTLRLVPPHSLMWRGWCGRWESVSEAARGRIRLAVAAFGMLVLAYPLTFTVRADAISGRDTRVHFAAAAGVSLLFAVLAATGWDALRAKGRSRIGSALIAGEVALLVGFGQVVQADYRSAWTSQQRFWSSLVTQIPDVHDGSVVLVEPGPLGDGGQIGANDWNLAVVLAQLYDFPDGWDTPPRVVRLRSDWRDHILSGEGPLKLDWLSTLSAPFVWGEIEGKDVILFLDEGGMLVRQSGPMDIAGQMTSLMTTDERGEPPYPHRLLYDLLIAPVRQD